MRCGVRVCGVVCECRLMWANGGVVCECGVLCAMGVMYANVGCCARMYCAVCECVMQCANVGCFVGMWGDVSGYSIKYPVV